MNQIQIFFFYALAGWVNREQQKIIDYLLAENKTWRELHRKKPRLNNKQRRLLAVKAKQLSRTMLNEVAGMVTPGTLLRWHRKLIAQKYDGSSKRRAGRPRKSEIIRANVVRMASENANWGYARIVGAMNNIGFHVARTTVKRILDENGIEPSHDRKTKGSWKQFLAAHWEAFAATDFFTVEAWTCRGLVRYHVLVVMELCTRRVHIAGTTSNPNGLWMKQIARNLTDAYDGFLLGKQFLIHDRDPLFTKEFRTIMKDTGCSPIRLPTKSPNLNAFAERFIRSIKHECLDNIIPLGEAHLRKAISGYVEHYHHERNHQGLENKLIEGDHEVGDTEGRIMCRQRMGGMLKYYYRDAA